ncbi:MAG: C40 family peptidase, partial [Thermoleophilia bacterium]
VAGAAQRPAAGASPPPSRWIAVSVATLWVQPGQTRAVDAPALGDPAFPRRWVAGMSVAQKRWLVGKLETQALYGMRVNLLGTSGSWSKVAVPAQPTPRSSWGYPGWVPTAQLTRTAPRRTGWVAVVRRPTAWVWHSPAWATRAVELSYGTRLPVARWTADFIEVVMLDGRHLYLRRRVAALHRTGTVWPTLTGAALVTEARRFLGLQYLWAGASGFGFDCSGFTWGVHRALAATIPRDAGPQSLAGERVASRASLRPGDVVFFRDAGGRIHHVGMYVGDGRMIHAPRTGAAVQLASLTAEPYASEFAGGRRYAP